MTIFARGPPSKKFFRSVRETEAQRPPSLPKSILVASGTVQHLWLILVHHRGLYPGFSLREEVQIDVATLGLGLAQGEKETPFEPLLSTSSFQNLTTVF